jgi:type I restriction enzyme S subunit
VSLPRGWAGTTLSQCSEAIQYGLTCTSSLNGEGYRYVRITDIQNGQIKWRSVPYANEKADKAKPYEIEVGDILFARTGATVGKSHLMNRVESPSVFASYLIRLRCSEGVLLPQFAARYFQSKDYWEQIAEGAEGTGQPNFNGTKLAALTLPLPPLPEQRRIVAKLDALTVRLARARAELDRAVSLSKKIRKAVLVEQFCSVEAPRIQLGEVLEDVRYGTSKKCDYDGGKTPVLRIPNVQGGRIETRDLKFAEFDQSELTKLSLRRGDVLVIRSNGSRDLVGKSAVIGENTAGMLYAGYLIRLRPDQSKLLADYLHAYLSSPSTRQVIEKLSRSSSGVNNINAEQLKKLSLPLPSIIDQARTVSALNVAFARADRLEAEADRAGALLDRLESSILAKAFKGELVPQDPNDEPASVLLDRIRAQRIAPTRAKHNPRTDRRITA